MEKQLLYYVVPKENFKAEDRVFLEGEKYPVYDNDGYSILCAENGTFNFNKKLMPKVIEDWELEVVNI
ncbi:hypothetical protein ACDX78_02280 [Virgibacillus oceani]